MQKPAYSMSIITVRPNETVPEALLIKLFSENRSAIGLAVHTNSGIVVEKFDEMDSVEEEVAEYQGILENTKANYRQICLSALPKGFDKSEIQPWVILKDSKDNPILTVACEGDFHKYTKEGQSEFFTLVNDYLGPKIEGLYKLLGNDPKKLMDYLRSTDFATDLQQVYGHRGVFEFMPSEGEPFAHGKNEEGLEASWGRASNVYGYTESVQQAGTVEKKEEPKTEEQPKRSRFASDEPAPQPITAPPKADPPTKPMDKADAKVTAEVPKKGRVDIPRNLHGKRKKAFIRDALGTLPDNWDSMTFIEVDLKTVVNSLADLNKTAVGQVKDMRGDAPAPAKENQPVPVISGQEQSALNGFIKKYLDGNSNRVENPLEIQKMEAKLPVFTEVAGQPEGLDFFDNIRSDVLKNLVEERPQSAWLLLLEYRSDRRKRKQAQAMGDKKLSELTGTEAPLEEPGKIAPASPTPGPASPPEAQPEVRKSRYA